MKYWSEVDGQWIEGESIFDGKRLPWQSDGDPAWRLGALEPYSRGVAHRGEHLSQRESRAMKAVPADMGARQGAKPQQKVLTAVPRHMGRRCGCKQRIIPAWEVKAGCKNCGKCRRKKWELRPSA